MAAETSKDPWKTREVRFANLNESRDAVNDPDFLESFFQVCDTCFVIWALKSDGSTVTMRYV